MERRSEGQPPPHSEAPQPPEFSHFCPPPASRVPPSHPPGSARPPLPASEQAPPPPAEPPPTDQFLDEEGPPPSVSLVPKQTSAQFEEERENERWRFDHPDPHHEWLHAGWKETREKIFSSLQRTGQSRNRIKRFTDCGENAWVYQSVEDPEKFRLCANHCGDRLCVPCGNLRAFWLRKALDAKILTLAKPPLLITITLKERSGESLSSLVTRLYEGFSDLRRLSRWKKSVVGGIALLEIKRCDNGRRWHPHLHIIADGRYIEQGWISNAWRALTGDSFRVWVERCHSIKAAIGYCTKYATKPLNTSFQNVPELLDEALLALKGRRLCLTFGEWYGMPLSGAEDDELEEAPVSDTLWTSIGSLADVLTAARRGDTAAVTAMRALRRAGSQPKHPNGIDSG